MRRALLLSGGMDSVALAWLVRPEVAYTVNYGHAAAAGEIRAATALVREIGIEHHVIAVDCSSLGSGDLSGRKPLTIAPVPEWWPYRNQLLVTLAGMRAVSDSVEELFIGSVSTDGKHADGRPVFFEKIDLLMQAQEGGLRISAPAIGLSTVELVRKSGVPRHVLAWSHSCHTGEYACGQCRGCQKHAQVMEELGYGSY